MQLTQEWQARDGPCASSVSTLASVVELLKVFAMIGASLEALVVPVPWVPCVPVVLLTAPGSRTSPVCGDKAADVEVALKLAQTLLSLQASKAGL